MTDRLNIPWAAGAPLTSPSRRLSLSPVGLALLGGTLLVVLLILVDWTAELLWFRALGYADVFWRLLFAEVAMFAIFLKDELLVRYFHHLCLESLDGGRDGGEELRRTLRAYFEADRNVSAAAAAVGVTRQAVARRLRTAEERLGRPIGSLGADLEIALRLEALAG